MLRTACHGILLIALCGCVNAPPVDYPETVVDKPALNRSETAELGGTVLEKGKYRIADALISENDIAFECGLLKARWTMPAGILIAQQRDANSTYYFSSRTTVHDALGDVVSPRGAALNVKNGNLSDIQAVLLPNGISCSLPSAPMLKSTQVPFLDATGFRLELVYGGRSGDMLKFQYREVSGDSTQPRVNQDFEWNLKDGMTVTFHGARIEVFGATNAQLNYEVMSSFADQGTGP